MADKLLDYTTPTVRIPKTTVEKPTIEDFKSHYESLLTDSDVDEETFFQGVERYHRDQEPDNLPTLEKIMSEAERGRKEKRDAAISGTLDVAGQVLKNLPKRVASAVAGHMEPDVVSPNIFQRMKQRYDKDSQKLSQEARQKYGDTKIPYTFGLLKITDLADLDQSTGFSLTAAGAGLVTGKVTSLIPGLGRFLKYPAGMLATGASAYHQAGNDFIQTVLEYHNENLMREEGRGLNEEEQEALKIQAESLAHKMGLWEAIPEAIGSGAGFFILVNPLTKVFGKNIATRFLTKLGTLYGEEMITETTTQMGQTNVQAKAAEMGLVNPDGTEVRSFADLRAWYKSAKEVAPQVFLLTTAMGGGVKVGTTVWDKAIANPKREQAMSEDMVAAINSGQYKNKLITDPILIDFYEKVKDVANRRSDDAALQKAAIELDNFMDAKLNTDSLDEKVEKFEAGDFFDEENNEAIIQDVLEKDVNEGLLDDVEKPREAPIRKASQVSEIPEDIEDQIKYTFKGEGAGVSGQAVEFGETATPEQLKEAESLKNSYELEALILKSQGDLQGAMNLSTKAQFLREALEASRGEHPSQDPEFTQRQKEKFTFKKSPNEIGDPPGNGQDTDPSYQG
jgi:hypothetical protein